MLHLACCLQILSIVLLVVNGKCSAASPADGLGANEELEGNCTLSRRQRGKGSSLAVVTVSIRGSSWEFDVGWVRLYADGATASETATGPRQAVAIVDPGRWTSPWGSVWRSSGGVHGIFYFGAAWAEVSCGGNAARAWALDLVELPCIVGPRPSFWDADGVPAGSSGSGGQGGGRSMPAGNSSLVRHGSGTGQPRGDAAQDPTLIIDSIRKKRALRGHPQPRLVDPGWGGARFFPGCFATDGLMHELRIGVIADEEAVKTYGMSVVPAIEAIVAQASFIYERQFNIRLAIADRVLHTPSAPSSPKYARGCDTMSKKLEALVAGAPSGDAAHYHLFTGCGPAHGVIGIAYLESLCGRGSIGRWDVGVTKLAVGPEAWLTFAHELGHNIGAKHSFEEGKHKTGGIMDYQNDFVNGIVQFNKKYRHGDMCAGLRKAQARCKRGEFDEAVGSGAGAGGSGGGATVATTARPTTTAPPAPVGPTCAAGGVLVPVDAEACPRRPYLLPGCAVVPVGSLCEANGECGTDNGLNNCDGVYDVYQNVAAGPTPPPTTVAPTTAGPGPGAGAASCGPGSVLVPVSADKCPPRPWSLPNCTQVPVGFLCEGDGECRTDQLLNNCKHLDVYRRVAAGPTPPPATPDPTTAAPGPAAACGDGLQLAPVAPAACPPGDELEANGGRGLPTCDWVGSGELCDGDGECGTDNFLNNCHGWDIYRKA